jgi:hypothetical protein
MKKIIYFIFLLILIHISLADDITKITFELYGTPFCGDFVCNGGETCSSCPTDCGICSSGGGGGGSHTYLCSNGKIIYPCECNHRTYYYGYCINGVYYSDISFTNETHVASNITNNYYFTIHTEKYAYFKDEPINVTIKTYQVTPYSNNTQSDIGTISLFLVKNSSRIDSFDLIRTSKGSYSTIISKTYPEGKYLLHGILRPPYLQELAADKEIYITNFALETNIIRTPTGQFDYKKLSIILIVMLVFALFFIYLLKNKKNLRGIEL